MYAYDKDTGIRLMKGNEALAEAAIRAGMDAYFGYPITPQTEILEYLEKHAPYRGGLVLQAESEIAAINMIYGAAACGKRVLTTSSSPGVSLMQEGISYIAAAQLPCLIVNVTRGGPGLGTIQPSQGDYFQSTKGGGHGDYRLIVLAPESVQEMADFVFDGFRLAEKYRNPALILSDGALGQMMEKVILPPEGSLPKSNANWAVSGKPASRERNIIKSSSVDPVEIEQNNIALQKKYQQMQSEVRWEEFNTVGADIIFVAYGLAARICKKTIELAKDEGINIGLIRPITLYPFPKKIISDLSEKMAFTFVVELNSGQMVEDVSLAVNGKNPVYFYGRMGGMVPTPEEVLIKIKEKYNSDVYAKL